MDEQTRAVVALRADGRSFRQIATQLGMPLTRVFKLARQALEPSPLEAETAAETETEASLAPPGTAPVPPAAPPAIPSIPVPAFEPPLLAQHLGYLTGPFQLPTREDLRRPSTVRGPGGTVVVILPSG